jgi:hypothetical protein
VGNRYVFHFTAHAQQRIEERGLSVEALKDVIKYHDHKQKQYAGEHGGTVFRFSKAVAHAKLTAVAEIKRNDCWILTGFYE